MLKLALVQSVWSYSVYSKTLKALQDAENIYYQCYQEEKENYIYKLTSEKWIEWIPYVKEYIITNLYDKGLFYLNYEIEEYKEDIVITINLRLNKKKIKEFIKFVAENNYLDIEEIDKDYIDEEIYEILETIADAIKEWDIKYLRSL